MPQSYVAMPTLVKNKVSRIILSSLIVVTALVVLGNMTGAIVDEKLHIVVAISAAAAIGPFPRITRINASEKQRMPASGKTIR